ncbi:MAG: DUF4956 domain-containing protein [Lachnospiraceae bacterium]|nr:DUF4956 domain-containing protein [Lachnospiraceae bacterium]
MTFNDIFKSSFLENVTAVSIIDMSIAIILSFALGLFIFFVYKRTFKGILYSSGFGVSLIALTMITTLVILAVTSNIVLSLGMVGALSIVRFRTAIKDPLDIVFLFWSIAVGIVLAAGLIPLAVFGSVFIGIILVIFVNKKVNDAPYIVIVNCHDEESEQSARKIIEENVGKSIVKSTGVSQNGVELTIEVRLKNSDTSFIHRLIELNGVSNAILVGYNGDYMS